MDNLTAHKDQRVKELCSGSGAVNSSTFHPTYSPDFNPIEEALAKIKGNLRKAEARSHEALIETIGQTIWTVSARDARGFFEHLGYRVMVQPF